MPTATPRIGRLGTLRVLVLMLLIASTGCSHQRCCCDADLSDHILPPMNADPADDTPAPVPGGKTLATEIQASANRIDSPVKADPVPPPSTPSVVPAACEAGQLLTVQDAINLAFRQQPRLQIYMEGIRQARGAEDVAFAPFLPTASAGYSVGGFNVNVGGTSAALPTLPGFIYEPFFGAAPVGLKIDTGYELAELKLQWLICDFGRRLGRYRQAGIAVDIAALQSERAFQTVANEVAVAYYQVLRTQALRKTAVEAVRRAQDDLDVAKKLEKGGVVEKEKRLRAEVQLAESQRLLDAAEGAEAIAVASLNLAIGLNVNAPTKVEETGDPPPFTQSLAECLQAAVGQRREFEVAHASIASADEGRNVAKADFAPRIVAEGGLFDFEQAAPRGHLDLPVGFIKLEWTLFEGGKRRAEVGIADSKIRAAMAQAESIADTIAFQVTEAYRNMVTARLGIDRSRPAVAQAEENYRLVKARAKLGDATSAEITDAESTLTRAQAEFQNSIHDYLIALTRLEYAMGQTPTPGSSGGPR